MNATASKEKPKAQSDTLPTTAEVISAAAPSTAKLPVDPPAISQILAKIEESKELAEDFKKDRTLELATQSLESAKAAKALADQEDDAVDPEDLVDRRIEAQRQIDIAEIRLARAKKALESRGSEVMQPLHEAGEIAAKALREIAEPFGKRLEAELRKLIGEDYYNAESGQWGRLIYRKGEVLYAHARQMESAVSIPGLLKAIDLLKDASRLG